MRRIFPFLLSTVLLAGTAIPAATPALAQTATPDARFAALSQRYIDSIARFSPVYGTQLGDHRFDDKLPDITAAGRARQEAFTRQLLADLKKIDLKVAEPREPGRRAHAEKRARL